MGGGRNRVWGKKTPSLQEANVAVFGKTKYIVNI